MLRRGKHCGRQPLDAGKSLSSPAPATAERTSQTSILDRAEIASAGSQLCLASRRDWTGYQVRARVDPRTEAAKLPPGAAVLWKDILCACQCRGSGTHFRRSDCAYRTAL